MSLAMTEEIGWNKRDGFIMKIDFIDIRRAYFHANALRDIYVDLPDEDYEEGMCGKLEKSMYGTRDAARNWEEAHTDFMNEAGFQQGIASPCLFYNIDREWRVVIHGDDFTILGKEDSLNWFRKKIEN